MSVLKKEVEKNAWQEVTSSCIISTMDIKEVAARGGQSTVNKYGKSYMSELGKKSAAARKLKKASESYNLENQAQRSPLTNE